MNPTQRAWSREDLCLFEMYYPTTPIEDLVEVLGRTEKALRSRAKLLGIKSESRRVWKAADVRRLRKLYPDFSCAEVAKELKATLCQVYNMAHKLKIKKSAKWKAEELARQTERLRGGVKFQFKPGQVPPNKGLRRPGYSIGRGRMSETTFKKGQRSGAANRNYKPVGTITKDADGFLIVKVYDNPEYKKNEGIVGDGKPWEYVHRRVWREHKGPIPPKTHIGFIDGNRENVDITNLEPIGFDEMCLRNSIHNLPPELVQVIQLNGALKRRIRRMANGKEQNEGPSGPSLRDDRGAEGRGKPDGHRARPRNQQSGRHDHRLGASGSRARKSGRR